MSQELLNPAINIEGVTKKYGKEVAVSNLNLKIPQGEVFGFIGPNGAGKTTTIKMLTGLLKPSHGKIVIKGVDIQESPELAKRVIGYIPDNPFLYDALSGREFLQFVGGLYGMNKSLINERIDYFFRLFDMDGWGDLRAEEYSLGMRQKVVISSALLHDPEVIIMDEPMMGLDPQSIHLVKNLLRERNRAGSTIFISTHNLEIAEELCYRIGIIQKGKLIALGTLEELKETSTGERRKLEDLYFEYMGNLKP